MTTILTSLPFAPFAYWFEPNQELLLPSEVEEDWREEHPEEYTALVSVAALADLLTPFLTKRQNDTASCGMLVKSLVELLSTNGICVELPKREVDVV